MNFITDTDFIPQPLDNDEYNLIYGTIQHSMLSDDLKDKYIYNLAAALCCAQVVTVLKDAKVKQWKKLLDTVINNLGKYEASSTKITIPFMYIKDDVIYIMNGLQLTKLIIEELEGKEISSIEIIENINAYPIESMEEQFINFMVEMDCMNIEGFDNSDLYIVTDEMIRRNIPVRSHINKSAFFEENDYKRVLVNNGVVTKQVIIQEENNVEETNGKLKKGIIKNKCGTIYYMLKNKVEITLIEKTCQFFFNGEFNDTISRYFRAPSSEAFGTIEYRIRENLDKYEIEIPEEIKPIKAEKFK